MIKSSRPHIQSPGLVFKLSGFLLKHFSRTLTPENKSLLEYVKAAQHSSCKQRYVHSSQFLATSSDAASQQPNHCTHCWFSCALLNTRWFIKVPLLHKQYTFIFHENLLLFCLGHFFFYSDRLLGTYFMHGVGQF